MDPPRGTRQAPFFSSQSLGGNIDFRFMRKPWAKIVTEELAADAIRTPGCVETGCWLHVDMAEGGDAEEYQQELMRWYPAFSQTYIVNPDKERARHYQNERTGSPVEIVDFHRDKFYSDGGDEEYPNLQSLATLALQKSKQPPAVGPMTPQASHDEDSIDEAWRDDVSEIWAGKRGIPCWVTRDPDAPGIKLANKAPSLDKVTLQGFPESLKNSDFKLTRCTGEDNFVIWFWLYRRATADNEVTVKKKKQQQPAVDGNYDQPCIVLIGSIHWQVTHDYAFSHNTTENPPSYVVNRGSTRTVFPGIRTNTDNWEYLTLKSNPQPVYHYPTKAEFKGSGLAFPDLRLDSSINKWTYFILKTSNTNVEQFSSRDSAPVTVQEMHTRKPIHDYNILNHDLKFRPSNEDVEKANKKPAWTGTRPTPRQDAPPPGAASSGGPRGDPRAGRVQVGRKPGKVEVQKPGEGQKGVPDGDSGKTEEADKDNQ